MMDLFYHYLNDHANEFIRNQCVVHFLNLDISWEPKFNEHTGDIEKSEDKKLVECLFIVKSSKSSEATQVLITDSAQIEEILQLLAEMCRSEDLKSEPDWRTSNGCDRSQKLNTMENLTFCIKYGNSYPVLFETHFTIGGEPRIRPLQLVGHLLAEVHLTIPSLKKVEINHISLHVSSERNPLPIDKKLSDLHSEGGGTTASAPLHVRVLQNTSDDESVGTSRKRIVECAGPVDPTRNYIIPINTLSWGNALENFVNHQSMVLLHGPWQSGKTSALRFLKHQAEKKGSRVYYIDMMLSESALMNCINCKRSIYQFLAEEISGSAGKTTIPELKNPSDFSHWMQIIHQNDLALPLLLLDEYDGFLKACRIDKQPLIDMNALISYSRNKLSTFSSIVCAGTFSIVASQVDDVSMEIDDDSRLERSDSEDSFDKIVQSFDVVSPWNKLDIVETTSFALEEFQKLCFEIFESECLSVDQDIVDDIWASTGGQPGFSMWLVQKVWLEALGNSSKLSIVDWMKRKRAVYISELQSSPTVAKIISRAKSSSKISKILLLLVRDNEVFCEDKRIASFLRAVGIARPILGDCKRLYFNSPIIRDALLQHFFPPYENIAQIIQLPQQSSRHYLIDILYAAIPHLSATQILDPLVFYSKGLSEASVHAELYRILFALFRNQPIEVLTESKVVDSSEVRCDLWVKTQNFSERGYEIKTELKQKDIQKYASGQLVKYASSRQPLEMALVNFVHKEVDSISFPIDIKPYNWGKCPETTFHVIFVAIGGDAKTGLSFRFAKNGDDKWTSF